MTFSIHNNFYLIFPPYILEYQDHGSDHLEHKILLYVIMMQNTYNLLNTNHPVNIVSYLYPRCYHNTHIWSYRLKLKQCHYSTLLNPQNLGQTTVNISWCICNASHWQLYPKPNTWRINILVFSTICTFILNWDQYFI